MSVPFDVVVSARRRYIAFRISCTGRLEVLLPAAFPESEAARAVARNQELIRRMLTAFSRRPRPPCRRYREGEFFPLWGKSLELKFSHRLCRMEEGIFMVPGGTPEEVRRRLALLYRKIAPGLLREKCREFGAAHGLMPRTLGVTDAASRWGSCSSRGHISFCWKIMLLPEELADYVVCHELAHLRHLDHSAAFWGLVEELCPGAQERRKKLRRQPELWPPPAEGNGERITSFPAS